MDLDFEEFRLWLADIMEVPAVALDPTARIVEALALDELSLTRLTMEIQGRNPYFHIPEQVVVDEITLADLYHFCSTMTVGHHEREVGSVYGAG